MQFSRFKRSDSVARDVRILRSQHHGSSYSLKAEQCSIGGLISSMPSLSKRSFVETNFALRRLGLNEIRTSLMTDPRSESRANDAEKHRAVSSQPTLTINGGSTPRSNGIVCGRRGGHLFTHAFVAEKLICACKLRFSSPRLERKSWPPDKFVRCCV